VRIATLDPLPGTARTPSPWPAPRTQPACQAPVTSSHSPGTPQVRDAAAPGKTRPVTADAQVTPSATSGFSCAPHTRKLTPRQQERLHEAFTADEAHKWCRSWVPLRPARARRLPPSHTRPRPTPGHSSRPAPTNVSHPRNCSPGPDPTQVEERPLGLLRHRRSQQRTPPKPSTDIIERGRRTARGYPNPTTYQPRMLLIAGGLDASTHTQL